MTLLVIAMGACVQEDNPVDCYNVNFQYRYYQPGDGDLLLQHIQKAQHFLFRDGILQESFTHSGAALKKFGLTLYPGNYTLVTWGNLNGNTTLSSLVPGKTRIDEVLLSVTSDFPGDACGMSDRLFFATKEFQVDKRTRQTHWVDYSHAHNVLNVTVRWRSRSPLEREKEYQMYLRDTYEKHSFTPSHNILLHADSNTRNESTEHQVVHTYPIHHGPTFIRQGISLVPNASRELKACFISLRYHNDQIPFFGLYDGDTPLFKEMDLTKVFTTFGWELTNNIRQEFTILIEVDGDKIYVSSAMVGDWEDGGSITGTF